LGLVFILRLLHDGHGEIHQQVMSFKTFTGFRGMAMSVELGRRRFIIVAAHARDLEAFHNSILTNAQEPFNPAACKKSIVIESSLLPPKRTAAAPVIDLDKHETFEH